VILLSFAIPKSLQDKEVLVEAHIAPIIMLITKIIPISFQEKGISRRSKMNL